MRRARFLACLLAALAAAGCARQQQAYYIVDPQTGQMVPVVQQYQQPAAPYGQPQYAQQPAYAQPQGAQQGHAQAPQPSYQPPPAAPQAQHGRGLFARSPAAAQQSYGQPAYAQTYQQPAYQQPAYQAPQQPAARAPGERGLFTSRRSARAPQPAPQYAMPQQGVGGPYVAAPNYGYAAAPSTYQPAYTLDAGDKLRIVVFGQDGITNSYTVGVDGNVTLPLVGSVPARGFTTQQLSKMIGERLKQGYVREPHVSVEVEAYRPFFILGEVTNPGQYPYVANMTAETAIAIAGGFSPRANKRSVALTRNAPGQQMKGDVPLSYPLRPGDTVVVKERWF
ncbi:MAG: polysaccharide biosynthesis/export family protein [Pseudolabrys sp.]